MPVSIGSLRLYTIPELAEKLGLTPVTIRNYIRHRGLPGQKIGHTWYISEDALEEYFSGGVTAKGK
jgi:excisionase family DNA binding protein